MPVKRRRRSSSRGRPSAVGLLLVLGTAIVLGVGVGSFVGREFGAPQRPQPAPGQPPRAVRHSGPIHPPPQTTRDTDRREPSHRHEGPPRRAAQPSEPRTPVETAANPEPRSSAPSAKVIDERRGVEPGTVRQPVTTRGEVARVAGSKGIALTLDAGASSAPTPEVLSALRSAGLHVTFFLTGKWAEQNEGLVRQMRQDGHEIGNHTYSHPDLRKLPDADIQEQLRKTEEIIQRITGRGCEPYFRPPYGGRDNRVLRIAQEAGYTAIYWSVDSWDAFKKGITSAEITKRVLDRARGGDIVLMHCGSQATADALPGLIRELQSRGYEIVTVSELLNR